MQKKNKNINVDVNVNPVKNELWEVRSIDTMKYSRDLARTTLYDKSFDNEIDRQMKDIVSIGANYVAIDTPYDEEFRPILLRWVQIARIHKLHIWFRGNFSGWEGWFDYPRIDTLTHIIKTKQFIIDNQDLFADGDIFTSCPECENGYGVNILDQKSLDEHRAFLIFEYMIAKEEFSNMGKRVKTGYYSMNGDLANALMDRHTTQMLGGVVVIDHYVDKPEKLAQDARDIAIKSGGKVLLGEFGAPIDEINGEMTENEQNDWTARGLSDLTKVQALIGVNYWVNKGGSSALWNDDGSARKVAATVAGYYSGKF